MLVLVNVCVVVQHTGGGEGGSVSGSMTSSKVYMGWGRLYYCC